MTTLLRGGVLSALVLLLLALYTGHNIAVVISGILTLSLAALLAIPLMKERKLRKRQEREQFDRRLAAVIYGGSSGQ